MHKPIYSYHTHIDPCSPPLLSPPTLYNTRRLLVSLTSHIRAKAQSTWRKAGGRESSRPPRVGRVHSEGLCKGFENSSGFLHYYLSLPPRRNGPRGLSLPCGKERERNVRRSLTYIYIYVYICLFIYTWWLGSHSRPMARDMATMHGLGQWGVASYAHTSKNKIGLGYFVKHFRVVLEVGPRGLLT